MRILRLQVVHQIAFVELLALGGVTGSVFLDRQQLFERGHSVSAVLLRVGVHFLQCEFGIKQPGVDDVWCFIALTHHENFCWGLSGRLWLIWFNFCEKLVCHIHQRVIILGPENLCNKGSSSSEGFGGDLQSVEGELDLVVGIHLPVRSDIGRTIIQNHVGLEMLQLLLYQSHAPLRRNICLECYATLDSWNRIQVDTNLDGSYRHIFRTHLKPIWYMECLIIWFNKKEKINLPSTWCCTKIDYTFSLTQKVVFLVHLDQLESCTRPEALFLSHIIELIQTPLSLLSLFTHIFLFLYK